MAQHKKNTCRWSICYWAGSFGVLQVCVELDVWKKWIRWELITKWANTEVFVNEEGSECMQDKVLFIHSPKAVSVNSITRQKAEGLQTFTRYSSNLTQVIWFAKVGIASCLFVSQMLCILSVSMTAYTSMLGDWVTGQEPRCIIISVSFIRLWLFQLTTSSDFVTVSVTSSTVKGQRSVIFCLLSFKQEINKD